MLPFCFVLQNGTTSKNSVTTTRNKTIIIQYQWTGGEGWSWEVGPLPSVTIRLQTYLTRSGVTYWAHLRGHFQNWGGEMLTELEGTIPCGLRPWAGESQLSRRTYCCVAWLLTGFSCFFPLILLPHGFLTTQHSILFQIMSLRHDYTFFKSWAKICSLSCKFFSLGYFVSALGKVPQVPRMLKALDSRIAILQIKIELLRIGFDWFRVDHV